MPFSNIKLAIIGSGRWGFNHIRTANSLLLPDQIIVCDTNQETESRVKELNAGINFTTDFDALLVDGSVNAAIVATPAETHYSIAKLLLDSGKNVLVEKPITLDVKEAEELLFISEEKNLKLMVGHVLLFHPAVKKMKELLDEGKIGKLQYISSNRLNLGAIRSEENILWSFAPHDISVIQYLTELQPINVFAKGADFIQNGIEDTTLTYLQYPNNISAHIHVSWLYPFKEQKMVVIGDEGMLVFEDSIKEEKLKLYAKGFKNIDGVIEKFDSDYEVIDFENKMPLCEEQIHFFESIENNNEPITNGKHAKEVLEILVKATDSLKN